MSISKRLFGDNLYPMSSDDEAPKDNAEREDESIAVADDLWDWLKDSVPHPEVALVSVIRTLADLIVLQEDEDKRARLVVRIKEALDVAVEEAAVVDDDEEVDDDENSVHGAGGDEDEDAEDDEGVESGDAGRNRGDEESDRERGDDGAGSADDDDGVDTDSDIGGGWSPPRRKE